MTTSRRVASALDTLREAPSRLREIRRGHQAALTELHQQTSNDPDLTTDGRLNAQRNRRPAVDAQWKSQLDALRREAEAAEAAVRTAVEAAWPKPTGTVEAMLSRQAAWARARSLLEAGRLSVPALIDETTDIEQLFALREEMPTWARVNGARPDSADLIPRYIDQRIATLGGGDLPAGPEADVLVASLAPLLADAESAVTGGSTRMSLSAALAAQSAARDLAAELASVPRVTGPGLWGASRGQGAAESGPAPTGPRPTSLAAALGASSSGSPAA